MNILILGSGGREHALSWAMAASPQVERVFCAPGNAGIGQDVTCVAIDIDNDEAIVALVKKHAVDMVIPGSEDLLAGGIVDRLSPFGIKVFGPTAAAARLESSKIWMKDFCRQYHIPTAACDFFDDIDAATRHIDRLDPPIVIKTDGLAAGKGVFICADQSAAKSRARDLLSGRVLPGAGKKILIEEYITGTECSFFALCNGENAIAMAAARDYKRAFDGDRGPNTGGMGTVSYPGLLSDDDQHRVMRHIIRPAMDGMADRGCPFIGILFAGLMMTKTGIKLLEFNVRFGDPECQVLMMRQRGIAPALMGALDPGYDPGHDPGHNPGRASDTALQWRDKSALCVVMASRGYPGPAHTPTPIRSLEQAEKDAAVKIFHAATQTENGHFIATGGRVLGVGALGDNPQAARAHAYRAVAKIDWPGGFFRRDIGL